MGHNPLNLESMNLEYPLRADKKERNRSREDAAFSAWPKKATRPSMRLKGGAGATLRCASAISLGQIMKNRLVRL